MASQKGLGRGLGALLGDFSDTTAEDSAFKQLPLHRVEPNPDQPRQDFNEEELQSLAESIRVHGVIQPSPSGKPATGIIRLLRGNAAGAPPAWQDLLRFLPLSSRQMTKPPRSWR